MPDYQEMYQKLFRATESVGETIGPYGPNERGTAGRWGHRPLRNLSQVPHPVSVSGAPPRRSFFYPLSGSGAKGTRGRFEQPLNRPEESESPVDKNSGLEA